MKKLILLTLALCLMLCACGGETTPETTGMEIINPQPEPPDETEPGIEPHATTPATADGFTFTYNGTTITMHAPAASIVEALGEPKKYTESASCAFEGLDKTYYYGSFYLDTYPLNGEDYVYGWWFADDTLATEEGIYIGATQQQVEAAYGAEAFNGTNAYTVKKNDTMLTVILEDGLVSSIQYAIILE